jgi:hypothetical protein
VVNLRKMDRSAMVLSYFLDMETIHPEGKLLL